MWKLDWLGRSVKDLVMIVCDLEQRGVHFKSLTDQIDTATTAGRFFFHVMASLAQMERDLTAPWYWSHNPPSRNCGRRHTCTRDGSLSAR